MQTELLIFIFTSLLCYQISYIHNLIQTRKKSKFYLKSVLLIFHF